jgi:hypothetical protein
VVPRTLIVTIAVLAASFATVASSRAQTQRHLWPRGQEQSFVASCVAEPNATPSYCVCALHWLEDRYTYAQVAHMYRYEPVKLKRAILRSGAACIR